MILINQLFYILHFLPKERYGITVHLLIKASLHLVPDGFNLKVLNGQARTGHTLLNCSCEPLCNLRSSNGGL